VCTGHCTVQCPVHRQPRAKIHFSCALSGGSPDSYCALSGVHRTGTVDCPVRPYRVLKKASSPQPSERLIFSASSHCSLFPGDSLSPPPPAISSHRRPPSPTGLRRPRLPLLPSSVSRTLPQFSSHSVLVSRASHLSPLCNNSKS
jgi:hypothetical protein